MKPFIFDYQKFNEPELVNIIFKIPESRNHNITIPIKYKFHNTDNVKPLLFKTPKIYMPFKPNITNQLGGYIRLSFDNLKLDHNLKDFYDFINNVDNYLEKKMIELNIIKSSKNIFKKTIKKVDGYPDYFNLNFNTTDIKCFDTNLKSIPIEEINGNFYAYFVIELFGFYYNKKTKQFRLIWHLVQFKLDKSRQIINECLFLDEDPDEKNTNSNTNTNENKTSEIKLRNHPYLEKYFKMLSVGIPKMAIKHKMTLSGMDDRYLDFSPDSNINSLPDDLKNKIPDEKKQDSEELQENQTQSINTNPLANMIKKIDFNNLKLNKITVESKNKIVKKDLRVPSLMEIQEAHKKLFEKKKLES
jgi:hypothetical protein